MPAARSLAPALTLTTLVVAVLAAPATPMSAASLGALGFVANKPKAEKPAPAQVLLWEEEQPDVQTALDEAIERFNASQSAVRVRRHHYKTEDLRLQFQMAGLAGRGPDLVLAPNDFAGVFSLMGLIQPVQTWADMGRFTREGAAAITDAAGQAWGVPINLGNHLMLFVDRAKIAKPPATVEAMAAVARPLTDARRHEFGLAFPVTEPFWFVPFLGLFGGQALSPAARPELDTPAMASALALVRGWKEAPASMPSDCDYACAETLFVERKAAMTINGDWAIGKYHAALGADLTIAPLPGSAATGNPARPMLSGKYLLVNARLKGAQLEPAQAFVRHLTSPEVQTALAGKTKRLPALAALQEAPVVRDDPLLAASKAALVHAQPMPMAVEMRAVWDAIRPQLQGVMAGHVDPKLAGAVMQKDALAKVADMTH
jgi:maltose-binding protein MalE